MEAAERSKDEPERTPQATPHRPAAVAPSPAQRVLALQRRAGNRAVGAALRLDRKVEVRDVGRGEASGFARVPELIDRLNALSPSLFWTLDGRELKFEQIPGLDPNNFR